MNSEPSREACFKVDLTENIAVIGHITAETIPPLKSTGKRNREVKEGEQVSFRHIGITD